MSSELFVKVLSNGVYSSISLAVEWSIEHSLPPVLLFVGVHSQQNVVIL